MCYMNASLQALLAAEQLREYFLHLEVDRENSENKLIYAFVWLSKLMSRAEDLDQDVELDQVIAYLGKYLAQNALKLSPDVQHDVHEFVAGMLDVLQKSILKLDPEKDICKDLFVIENSYMPAPCPR
jgi:ubiquitin C-terminal hydrolase